MCYDDLDRLVRTEYNNGRYITYAYNAEGALAKVSYGDGDSSDMDYLFEYDSSGRLVRSTQSDSAKLYQRTEHLYDEFGRLYIQRWTIDGKTRSEKYTYDDGADGDGSMTQFKTGSGQRINFSYDALRRLSEASVANSSGQELFKTAYSYKTISGDQTSTQVRYRNVRTTEGDLITGYKYTYDALGNITEIRQSEGSNYLLFQYTYDAQNQLTKEIHYDGTGDTSSAITATYTYTYDTAGNLRSETKTVGTTSTTKTYSYGNTQWADLLTAVTANGTTYSLSYDASGNPLTYHNGTNSYTDLTWEHGRQLASITTGGNTYSYTYDLDGIRTQKVVDGVTHTYTTLNGKVVRESFPYGDTTIIMDFIYDESGRPFSVAYSKNGGTSFTNYFYATNAQGDVEGLFRVLLNEDTGLYEQKWYGHYYYDAWGNVTATTAAGNTPADTSLVVRNPIRYRGYYYDTETGFYYLQSRYYDPANHRFINADSYASTGQGFLGHNMFVYCLNCPVIFADSCGTDAILVINEEMAGGYGHVSLFVQDGNGIWHYYSFASNRNSFYTAVVSLSGSVEGKLRHENLGKSEGYDLSTFAGFQSFLLDSGKVNVTAEGMDHAIYMEGDFSETYFYCDMMEKRQNDTPLRYNLYSYNCMTFAILMLRMRNGFTFSEYMLLADIQMYSTIPNNNIDKMEKLGVSLK